MAYTDIIKKEVEKQVLTKEVINTIINKAKKELVKEITSDKYIKNLIMDIQDNGDLFYTLSEQLEKDLFKVIKLKVGIK